MKTRIDKRVAIFFLSFLMGLAGMSDLLGQGKEYDDMYFSSKDRAFGKATAAAATSSVAAPQVSTTPWEYTYSEDSYSARTVNPEYIARYKEESSDIEQEAPIADTYSSQDYFVEDYDGEGQTEPTVVNNYNSYYGYPSNRYSSYNSF